MVMSHQIIYETLEPLSKKNYITMTELGKAMGSSRPTTGDRVTKCERRGLIFTMKSGREKLIYLTDKNKKLRDEITNMESTLYSKED